MRRRDFIKGIVGSATVWPLATRAQQTDGKAHVGLLGPSLDNVLARTGYEAFATELQKLGFSEGAWTSPLPQRESLSLQRPTSLSPSDRKYPCGQRWRRIPACR